MPTDQHAQRPEEHGPPPCDCGGCREFRAIHGALCLEVPIEQRISQRAADGAAQHRFDFPATTPRRAA